ncbi:MAG TPA: phage portal protein, partial [Bacteroidetes bacterium]|nr:phage portal protein [Bacteroidota bacterium]
MLVNGEFINIPLMLDSPEYDQRRYRLALQVITPSRLRTPANLGDDQSIRDGIRLGKLGDPTGYFIADPPDGNFISDMSSNSFVELPPKRGHRHVVMHRFHSKEPEQTR